MRLAATQAVNASRSVCIGQNRRTFLTTKSRNIASPTGAETIQLARTKPPTIVPSLPHGKESTKAQRPAYPNFSSSLPIRASEVTFSVIYTFQAHEKG